MHSSERGKRSHSAGLANVTRRTFLQGGALTMAGLAGCGRQEATGVRPELATVDRADDGPILRVGLVADAHYADRPARKERHYRASVVKLREAVTHFNRIGVDLTIELGDFIDAADALAEEIGYLHAIEAEFAALAAPRYYVLGNHCLDSLSKYEFVSHCGAQAYRALLPACAVRSVRGAALGPTIPCDESIDGFYYSFDHKGYHFVVLDACYRPDGTPYCRGDFHWSKCFIPESQLTWLQEDLQRTAHPTIVHVHQRLDTEEDHSAVNARDVRTVLEAAGKVRVVLQGHDHRGDFTTINGIAYVTLLALVSGPAEEGGAYGVLEVSGDGAMRLEGFRGQASYTPAPAAKG